MPSMSPGFTIARRIPAVESSWSCAFEPGRAAAVEHEMPDRVEPPATSLCDVDSPAVPGGAVDAQRVDVVREDGFPVEAAVRVEHGFVDAPFVHTGEPRGRIVVVGRRVLQAVGIVDRQAGTPAAPELARVGPVPDVERVEQVQLTPRERQPWVAERVLRHRERQLPVARGGVGGPHVGAFVEVGVRVDDHHDRRVFPRVGDAANVYAQAYSARVRDALRGCRAWTTCLTSPAASRS
jgi:hypothetical protein